MYICVKYTHTRIYIYILYMHTFFTTGLALPSSWLRTKHEMLVDADVDMPKQGGDMPIADSQWRHGQAWRQGESE